MYTTADKFLLKDKLLNPLVKQFGPCKLKKRPQKLYFESLVRAITGQQLSVNVAATIYSRLEQACGGKITPNTLLSKRVTTLRKVGLSNAKATYVKDLAKHVNEGLLEITKLDKLSEMTG